MSNKSSQRSGSAVNLRFLNNPFPLLLSTNFCRPGSRQLAYFRHNPKASRSEALIPDACPTHRHASRGKGLLSLSSPPRFLTRRAHTAPTDAGRTAIPIGSGASSPRRDHRCPSAPARSGRTCGQCPAALAPKCPSAGARVSP